MVVFRLRDRPIGLAGTLSPPHSSGLLAGKRYTEVFNSFVTTNPGTTLAKLSLERSEKLGGRTVRVVGDPNLSITHAPIRAGASGQQDRSSPYAVTMP
jgi:hypothetical protein